MLPSKWLSAGFRVRRRGFDCFRCKKVALSWTWGAGSIPWTFRVPRRCQKRSKFRPQSGVQLSVQRRKWSHLSMGNVYKLFRGFRLFAAVTLILGLYSLRSIVFWLSLSHVNWQMPLFCWHKSRPFLTFSLLVNGFKTRTFLGILAKNCTFSHCEYHRRI